MYMLFCTHTRVCFSVYICVYVECIYYSYAQPNTYTIFNLMLNIFLFYTFRFGVALKLTIDSIELI